MFREISYHNHILNGWHVFYHYVVDIYIKVKTDRLTYFVRLHQAKLSSEEYLQDVIISEGNAQNIDRSTIFPAIYDGSPRHIHE